jgi:hypothetical protein
MQQPVGSGLTQPAGLGIFAGRPIQLPGIRPDFSATIDPNFKPVEELKAVQPGDPGLIPLGRPTTSGFETSFGFMDFDPNRERQYFYNKDLNRLFNLGMGTKMAAPKGFESVSKEQYEDFASKGATLQKASPFVDAMGGGYNLDIPRDKFGTVDRTSSDYLYFFGDQQKKSMLPAFGTGPGINGGETITSISEGLKSGRLIPEGFEGPKGPGIVPGMVGGTRFVPNPAFGTGGQGVVGAGGRLGIPAAGYADGGNVVGGEYDFESARQMYGLGKLVKKVTRTVKKIAKSPVGKLAIGAAVLGTPFGAGARGTGFFGPKSLFGRGLGFIQGMNINKDLLSTADYQGGPTSLFSNLFSKIPGGGITAAIAGTSLLAGLLTPEQEEEAQELSRGEGIDIEAARNSILARAQGNIKGDLRATAFLAEGGKPEPVAKKTMPLLDMGGKEMDLREEGGFVPIGRMEKADDVPARLSKNEFVFTADAVRNAGDGDVDKGAEVMYNMMKNLEAGGEVSEESQGLEGARKMFQTSQRLEEVL